MNELARVIATASITSGGNSTISNPSVGNPTATTTTKVHVDASTKSTGNSWWWNGISSTATGIGGLFAGIPKIPGMASAEVIKLQAEAQQDIYKELVRICLSGFVTYSSLWLISDCTRDIAMLLPRPNVLESENTRKNDDKILPRKVMETLVTDDPVESRYKGGEIFLPGKVLKVNGGGTHYDIRFCNGDEECDVPVAHIRSISTSLRPAAAEIDTGSYYLSKSPIQYILGPMLRPCAEMHTYIKGIPRTGREQRGYIPMILLTIALATEKAFLRSSWCMLEAPPQLLRDIFLPGAVAVCGVWCSWKANFEAEKLEYRITSGEDIDQEVAILKGIIGFKVSRRWISKAKTAAYSILSSLMFSYTTGR